MGWTGTHKPENMNIREFFEKEFNYAKPDGRSGKILDCAVKNRTTAYVAFEIIAPERERQVVALVCLIRYSREYFNLTYKDMDENVGPYETE